MRRAFEHAHQGEQNTGLAQARRPYQQREAPALLNGIEERRDGFTVLRCLIKEPRIGRNAEGFVTKSEVGMIHIY